MTSSIRTVEVFPKLVGKKTRATLKVYEGIVKYMILRSELDVSILTLDRQETLFNLRFVLMIYCLFKFRNICCISVSMAPD